MMTLFESALKQDKLAVLFRWLILIVIGIVATLTKWFTPVTLTVLIALGVWNVIISVLSFLELRLRLQSHVSVIMDVLAACALFIFSGGLAGSMVWIGVLPIVNAGIYFGWHGVLWAGGIIALTQIIWITLGDVYGSDRFMWMGIALAGDVLIILGMGWLSSNLLPRYFEQVEIQDKYPKTADEDIRQIGKGGTQSRYFQVLDGLNTTMKYPDILNAILDSAIVAMGEPRARAEQMVQLIMQREVSGFSVICSRALTVNDQRVVLPGALGALQAAQDGVQMVIPFLPADDPELERIIAVRVCKSAVAVPLLSAAGLYGVLILAHPDKAYFNEERRATLELFGYNAAVAIQNSFKIDEEKSKPAGFGAENNALQKQVLNTLQNGPVAAIHTIAQSINRLQYQAENDPIAMREELAHIGQIARQAEMDFSRLAAKTKPTETPHPRLDTALLGMAKNMEDSFQQKMNVQLDEPALSRLDPSLKKAVFRISDELTNHARVYSDAERINLRLRTIPQDSDILMFEMTDNGTVSGEKSIKTSLQYQNPQGYQAIREQVNNVQGLFYMDATPEKGNRVRVFLPLSQKAADRLRLS